MANRFFHGTRGDLAPRLREIEAQFELKYVRKGIHDSPDVPEYRSAMDIPRFGTAVNSYMYGNPQYLVCTVDAKVFVEAVPQDAGGAKYFVELERNDSCFVFNPGGRYDARTLVGGAMAPNSVISEVRRLYLKFARTITKGFTKVLDFDGDPWYVGPEALALLIDGADLVTDSTHSLNPPGIPY